MKDRNILSTAAYMGDSFEVLRWSGRGFSSVARLEGGAPALVEYPSTPARHVYDASLGATGLFGTFVRDVDGDGREEILVETRAGERLWWRPGR